MIDITEKKVPHLFRNKYLRNAGSGSVNNLSQSPGATTPGASVDVVKSDSSTVPSDSNVLSSLRALLEIRSRIIASTDTETAPSEENTLSSLRIVSEIDAAISEALEAIDEIYLSKTKADTAAEAITFLKGLFVGDNLAFINASGDAEVKSLIVRMKAKVATLEVTGAASVESLVVGQTATTLNLLVQELADIYDLNVTHVATMFRTIIKDYVSSETFIPGLMGEGMKIYKALNGDWNLEIDNVVVRKVMTIFELVVSKLRAVNGGLVISPANGRIKSVAQTTGEPTYYVLGIEGDNQFVADDLVRCQVFTSGQAKYYWVAVASVTADSILVLKSEFADGVTPAPGDDLVQMGNRTNTARQGLLYLTASEDGKPRFSVMDGVNSTSTVGKSKVILGCLDGMTDTDFPADFQPSGYGLYAMNVFLKGVFLLRNGKTVESELESAKNDAEAAKDKAELVTQLLQEFTMAGGVFESKISEVKEYADDKADAAKSAAIGDAAGKYNTKSEITTLIGQTKDAINLSVTEKISNVQSQITANSAAIQVNSEAITLSATKVTGLGNRLTSAEGSLSVQATQIAAQVRSVDDLTGRVSSAELALSPDNIWLGIKSNVSALVPTYTKQIDTKGLDPNKYYLVTIRMATTTPYTITVERSLDGSYGVPPYSTHGGGFSVMCKWQSNGYGWGTIAVKRIIQAFAWSFVDTCPVGSIGQIYESSEEIVYVRGGSVYNVRVDGTSHTDINLHTGTYTPHPDHPGSSRPGVIDSVTTPIVDLDTKPSKDELLSTGIDITNRKIVLTSDKVVFQNNSGGQIALFENDRIKADLIDAKKIVTNVLAAEAITATNLTVTGNSKIGGWSVSGNDLTCNSASTAKIRIEIDGGKFLRINDLSDAFLAIRHDSGDCIRLYTQSTGSTALAITAQSGNAFAIKSAGGHQFMQRSGEAWNAPGVLWCGRMNAGGTILSSWGNGLNRTPSISRYATGKYSITHNLGHTEYYPMAIAELYTDRNNLWGIMARYGGVTSNAFCIEFKNDGGSDENPKEFQVMIFGRNKWY